jgi:hypothetical protein
MARKKKPGIAWTLTKAGIEFGFDSKTVAARLSYAGTDPDARGRYTTRQIAAALYGDERAEKQRLLAEQIKHAALKNAKNEGKLIPLESAIWVAQKAAFAVRQRIMSLDLPEDERRSVLTEIASLAGCDFTKGDDDDDYDTHESNSDSGKTKAAR